MAKEEETVTVDVGLCDMEIGSDERYEQRIENVVDKFEQDFFALAEIGL